MIIAYDAKRAYHNRRGLGNYSRDLIRLMTIYAPENNYYLLNPKAKDSIKLQFDDKITQINPTGAWKLMPSLWRTYGCNNTISQLNTDIYHGLSSELPYGIHSLACRKIVTIHDAIFMRFPDQYSASYRQIILQKCRYACKSADTIVAISQQTKQDCIYYFGADEHKIQVIYQGCNNRFRNMLSQQQKDEVIQRHKLPEHYILYVGAIEPNKNISNLIKAIHIAHAELPLVIASAPSKYAQDITALAQQLGVTIDIRYQVPAEDLPAIYQNADLFAFMSYFEGFGIPVLEAVCSHIPIIASKNTCLQETGGNAALYAEPGNPEEIAEQINLALNDTNLRQQLINACDAQAEKFSDTTIARNLIKLYRQ